MSLLLLFRPRPAQGGFVIGGGAGAEKIRQKIPTREIMREAAKVLISPPKKIKAKIRKAKARLEEIAPRLEAGADKGTIETLRDMTAEIEKVLANLDALDRLEALERERQAAEAQAAAHYLMALLEFLNEMRRQDAEELEDEELLLMLLLAD